MKKQIVNNKVLRVIAIAMSAMIVTTSLPVGSFAADGEEQNAEENVTIEDGIEACGVIDEMTSRDEDNDGQSAVEVVVFEAIDETYSLDDDLVSEDLAMVLWDREENDRVGIINQDVSDFNDELSTIKDSLDTADKGLSDKINKADNDLNTFETNEKKVSDNLTSLSNNVNTANTSPSSAEAKAAADSAQTNLENIQKGVEDAQKALEAAGNDVTVATNEYNTVKGIYDEAQMDLDKAKEKLENAEGNATAANEHMKAAQARVDSLAGRLEKLGENKEASIAKLEAIQKQYYAMQVQYYRDALGDKAVYNDDGTLNIEACANNISEKTVNDKAKNGKNLTFELGRNLLEQLITFKLSNDENIDPSTIKIGTSDIYENEGKVVGQRAREGVVYTNADGKDQVYDNKGSTKTQSWVKSTTSDFGRTNHIKVTYTDKSGTKHSEYYNYIFKKSNENCNDTLDMQKGMIYLADISQNEDGTWVTKKDDSIYSFDDYQELIAVINVLNDPTKFEEYQKELQSAKEAADNAAAEVQKLYDEVEKLKKVSISKEKLDAAVQKLEEAQGRYAEAQERADQFKEQLTAAENLIKNIDPSRFNDDDDDTDSDDTDDVTAGAASAINGVTLSPVVAPTDLGDLAGVAGARTGRRQQNNGVAGVRVDENGGAADQENTTQIGENQTPKGATPVNIPADKKEIKKVENNTMPLAAAPHMEDGVNPGIISVSIAVLLAVMAGLYYEYNRRKKAKAEEMKKYKKD